MPVTSADDDDGEDDGEVDSDDDGDYDDDDDDDGYGNGDARRPTLPEAARFLLPTTKGRVKEVEKEGSSRNLWGVVGWKSATLTGISIAVENVPTVIDRERDEI